MQFVLKNRSIHVLFELLAVAALVAAVSLGAGCWQPSGEGVRILGGGDLERVLNDGLAVKGAAPRVVSRGRMKGPGAAAKAKARKPLTLSQLVGAYEGHLKSVKGLTYQRQRALHRRSYLKRLGLKVGSAEFHGGFVKAFGLTLGARHVLGSRGFVVVPALERKTRRGRRNGADGPSNLFYRVFAANLPVFVSADAILHAWHRAFDKLVAWKEAVVMVPLLRQLLKRTMAKLDRTQPAGRDAYNYLAVARTLAGEQYVPNSKWRAPAYSLLPAVRTLVAATRAQRPRWVAVLGKAMRLDARRFAPVGRYAKGGSDLAAYFKAMTWLSQVELLLYHPRRRVAWQGRQEAAARALVRAMKKGGALKLYGRLERVYSALMGRPLAVTPVKLLALCGRAGVAGCDGGAQALGAMAAQYRGQPKPPYSAQTYAPDREALRLSLFPQRFAYDVWVTSRTTTPGLPPRRAFGRSMARDLDIAFALGSDRALERMRGEMGLRSRKQLPAALEALRRTLRAAPPSRVADAVYSHWLEALMALSKTDLSTKLPRVMRTAAWQDRKLEAALGSLVELRQDAAPLVRPSLGGKGCRYPKGYVEPVPGLFRAVARAAARLATLFPGAPKSIIGIINAGKSGNPGVRTGNQIRRRFLKHWQRTMARLASLAALQLTGKPMSKKDLRFLSNTVDRHAYLYSGGRSYDGWYPRLFWNGGWEARGQGRKVTIYDSTGGSRSRLALTSLHLDVDRGKALQAAVGHMGLLVVAIDVGGKTALYGGPAYNYYRFERKLSQTVSPAQWEYRITRGVLPLRPRFARAYHAR